MNIIGVHSPQLIAAFMQICTFVFPRVDATRHECVAHLVAECKEANKVGMCVEEYLAKQDLPGNWAPWKKGGK